MIELTGLGSVLRGFSILYWLLAIGSLWVMVRFGYRWWGKTFGIIVVLVGFGMFPVKIWLDSREKNAYAMEAWAHFRKLCTEKSGYTINKRFSGVKSVLVIKPLPPAKGGDEGDQFWYGDPYSEEPHSLRTRSAATNFTLAFRTGEKNETIKNGLTFVEMQIESSGEVKFERVDQFPHNQRSRWIPIQKPESRFGIAWEDISTPEDRKYWVAGSRLSIVDLLDKSLVAERIGYFIEAGFGSRGGGRRPWLTSRGPNTTCPAVGLNYIDSMFISYVLNPDSGD